MPGLPRRSLLFAGLCFVVLGASGPQLDAQSVITVSPQQCVWRAGDDPAWAAPGLDESGWQPSSQWKIPVLEPHLWARCHADLGALRGTAHPAIQISLNAAYQFFVNGVRIGDAGNVHTGFYSMNTIRQYPLLPAALHTQPDIIALRMTYRGAIWTTSPLEIHIGDAEALAGRRASVVLAQSATPLAIAVCFALIGVVGLMLLGLFYYDRSRVELLYLSMVCVGVALLRAQEFFDAAQMNYPWVLDVTIVAAGNILLPVASVLFYFSLARRRVPRLYWLPVAVVVARVALLGSTSLLPPEQALRLWRLIGTVTVKMLLVLVAQFALSAAPFIAFWPYRRISRRMRPLAVLCMLWGAANAVWFAAETTANPVLRLPNLLTAWRPDLLWMRALVTASVLVALLGLLFRDQRRVTEERAVLAGEMQAASEIQHMLAPAAIETAPGLRIEVAFRPMRDVGGDFYLCRVLPGGRQRVLVGDVSGKGAAAAMTAALLLGGAERRGGDSPGRLLAHLNGVLHESHVPGFATCLCADFAPGGTVTVANAGHPAPYCRGEEIAVTADLPLGLKDEREGAYAETRYEFAPGGTLTFFSDGVAEARNAAGELFGFERAREISSLPAARIAEAAERFGQQDDITVLTLTRLGAGEQAAAGLAGPAFSTA
ncbi:MAG: serine/threonine-protein phosphatase [Acidobacteriota bacterium]|nr:serine/threonine-protein phosphatase [Acidobacteriota bacterium]